MKEIKQKNLELCTQCYPYLSEKLDKFFDFEQINEFQFSFVKKRNQITARKYFLEKNVDAIDSNLIIFVGLGDGYFLSELLKKSNSRSIIVVEPDHKLFNTVISERDLSDIFKDTRVSLFIGNNYNDELFHNIILGNISFLMDFCIIVHPLYNVINHKMVVEALVGIKSAIRYITRAVGNSPADSFIGFVNTLNNLRYFIDTVDIEYLKVFTKGKPIVIVSAGPSLEKNIDVLHDIKDNVYIIAATTIYKRLINKGIKPDAISILERDEEVYDLLFKNQEYPEDLILFSQSLVNHKIYEHYKGPIITFFRQESFFDNSISTVWGNINCFQPGSSVAHMNFQIANILEGSPIILMGQDLAYAKDGKTHATNTIYDDEEVHLNFDVNTHRNEDNKTIKVIGYNNSEAITNELWNYFKYWFETQISSRNLEIYNCTEGGARINGTIEMKLIEVIDKFEIKMHKKEEWLLPKLDINQIAQRQKSIKQYLDHELNLINQIVDEVQRMHKAVDDIQTSYKKGDFDSVSALFKCIYDSKKVIDYTSPFYNFMLQTFRIVNEQKEYFNGNITTTEKFNGWLSLQLRYVETNENISNKIKDVLSFFTTHLNLKEIR